VILVKKVFLAAAIALALALSAAGPALSAQTEQKPYIDVCVNASNAAAAKALFPTARMHVIPDDPNPDLNGWVVIVGFGGDKHSMTDAEEIAVRRRNYQRTLSE
jgi:hypothetical protein